MVDFSCALKLAIPILVLSAIREVSGYHITVKGGKYLQAAAEASIIVFDKTGTLTKAVVKAAKEKGLEHKEMHSKVEYIVVHGIFALIEEKCVIIGSYHFVFEDEHCKVSEAYWEQFKRLPMEFSPLSCN